MIIQNPTVHYDEQGNRTVVLVPMEVPDPSAAELNEQTLRSRANTALATNQTFLNVASPNNTQIINQVKALTRQVDAIIRLTLGALDTIDDS